MKRRRKADFLGPIYKLQDHINQGKRKEKKKERRGGKEVKRKNNGNVALLVFIMATLQIVFGRKKLLDAKGKYNYLAVTFSKIRLEI